MDGGVFCVVLGPDDFDSIVKILGFSVFFSVK